MSEIFRGESAFGAESQSCGPCRTSLGEPNKDLKDKHASLFSQELTAADIALKLIWGQGSAVGELPDHSKVAMGTTYSWRER